MEHAVDCELITGGMPVIDFLICLGLGVAAMALLAMVALATDRTQYNKGES
jgi:hypothetical protein